MSKVLGIPSKALVGANLDGFSVAKKMSWAAKRQTTRVEDTTYCLLGIFDISMPLLYGEGMKAFERLQEEIIKSSNDQSLFAWGLHDEASLTEREYRGYLAKSPTEFAEAGAIVPYPGGPPYSVTNTGLQISLPFLAGSWTDLESGISLDDSHRSVEYAVLRCHNENEVADHICIPLVKLDSGQYVRAGHEPPRVVGGGVYSKNRCREISLPKTIRKHHLDQMDFKHLREVMFVINPSSNTSPDYVFPIKIDVVSTYPPNLWQQKTRAVVPSANGDKGGAVRHVCCLLGVTLSHDFFRLALSVGLEFAPWCGLRELAPGKSLQSIWVENEEANGYEYSESDELLLHGNYGEYKVAIEAEEDLVMGPNVTRVSFKATSVSRYGIAYSKS